MSPWLFHGAASNDTLTDAFDALRYVNDRLAHLKAADFEPKPAHVHLDVGEVFRHRRHGFRGVVVGWWPRCPEDDDSEWVQTWGPFEDGTEQAFYKTLVCTRDRPAALVTVAAGENLARLPLDEARAVEHPLLEHVFDRFNRGRHVMRFIAKA